MRINFLLFIFLSILYDITDATCYYYYSYYYSSYRLLKCYSFSSESYSYTDYSNYVNYVNNDKSSLIGAIIGTCIGCLVGLVILITCIVLICRAFCRKTSGVRGIVVAPAQPTMSVVTESYSSTLTSYPQNTAPMPYPSSMYPGPTVDGPSYSMRPYPGTSQPNVTHQAQTYPSPTSGITNGETTAQQTPNQHPFIAETEGTYTQVLPAATVKND